MILAKNRFNPKAPICPECGGRIVHYRAKSNDFLCRRCGHSGPRATFFKSNKKTGGLDNHEKM